MGIVFVFCSPDVDKMRFSLGPAPAVHRNHRKYRPIPGHSPFFVLDRWATAIHWQFDDQVGPKKMDRPLN
jgi:hypothetical protein